MDPGQSSFSHHHRSLRQGGDATETFVVQQHEISISIQKVASVHIKTGLIWSTIVIESSGGSDPLTSHGHRKGDARRIKELLEGPSRECSGLSRFTPDFQDVRRSIVAYLSPGCRCVARVPGQGGGVKAKDSRGG